MFEFIVFIIIVSIIRNAVANDKQKSNRGKNPYSGGYSANQRARMEEQRRRQQELLNSVPAPSIRIRIQIRTVSKTARPIRDRIPMQVITAI